MILVIGSTGELGRVIVQTALEDGRAVTAMVRDESSPSARLLRDLGARLVRADLKDLQSVETALQDASSVICTATSTQSRQGTDSLESVDRDGIQRLISAWEDCGVERFVFVSFSHNIGVDCPLVRYKRLAEGRLAASSLDYTILLPSFFPEMFLSPLVGVDVHRGTARVCGDGTRPISYITIPDVARAAVLSTHHPAAKRSAIPLGGPRGVSQREAIALMERASAKRIALTYWTSESIRSELARTDDPLKASYLGLYLAYAEGDLVGPGGVESLGISPDPLESWIAKTFRS